MQKERPGLIRRRDDGQALLYRYKNERSIFESELLATYLLHKLKWELLGKTVLLPATVIYQARRAVPALKGCQSANINRLRLALTSRS